eukprot:gene2944-1926_t
MRKIVHLFQFRTDLKQIIPPRNHKQRNPYHSNNYQNIRSHNPDYNRLINIDTCISQGIYSANFQTISDLNKTRTLKRNNNVKYTTATLTTHQRAYSASNNHKSEIECCNNYNHMLKPKTSELHRQKPYCLQNYIKPTSSYYTHSRTSTHESCAVAETTKIHNTIKYTQIIPYSKTYSTHQESHLPQAQNQQQHPRNKLTTLCKRKLTTPVCLPEQHTSIQYTYTRKHTVTPAQPATTTNLKVKVPIYTTLQQLRKRNPTPRFNTTQPTEINIHITNKLKPTILAATYSPWRKTNTHTIKGNSTYTKTKLVSVQLITRPHTLKHKSHTSHQAVHRYKYSNKVCKAAPPNPQEYRNQPVAKTRPQYRWSYTYLSQPTANNQIHKPQHPVTNTYRLKGHLKLTTINAQHR